MKRIVLLSALLAGCAQLPASAPAELPLRLAPASLGRELALQERMTVNAHGHAQQLDLALEVDAQAVRLAVLAFGQTVARLEWDGAQLREQRAPRWPASIAGAAVLRDVQLVHWPLAAITPALPAGWSLQAEGSERVLRHGDAAVIRVRYPAPGIAELHNLQAGYALRLEMAEAEAQR